MHGTCIKIQNNYVTRYVIVSIPLLDYLVPHRDRCTKNCDFKYACLHSDGTLALKPVGKSSFMCQSLAFMATGILVILS
jgi:hypothetical protein